MCIINIQFVLIADCLQVGTRQVVHIHPTSALHGVLPPLVLFTELTHTGKNYIRYLTPVDVATVHELVPESIVKKMSTPLS